MFFLRKLPGLNLLIVAHLFLLCAMGCYAIRNATADRQGMESQLSQHGYWLSMGGVVFLLIAVCDYHWIRRVAWLVWPVAIAGLYWPVAELRSLDHLVREALQDWALPAAQMSLVATLLVLAMVFSDTQLWPRVLQISVLRLAMGIFVVWGMAHWLLLLDEASSVVVAWLALAGMLLVGSIPLRYTLSLVLILVSVAGLWYFFGRLPTYGHSKLDIYLEGLINCDIRPKDILARGWNTHHAMLAVGSAGLEGKGPFSENVLDGASIHRSFLASTATSTHLISVVIGEEFGFRGMMVTLGVYCSLLVVCMHVVRLATDSLGRVLVVGIMAILSAHVVIHLGACVALTPINDLPLPLISAGGASVLMPLFLLGLVQSVWLHREAVPVPGTAVHNTSL